MVFGEMLLDYGDSLADDGDGVWDDGSFANDFLNWQERYACDGGVN